MWHRTLRCSRVSSSAGVKFGISLIVKRASQRATGIECEIARGHNVPFEGTPLMSCQHGRTAAQGALPRPGKASFEMTMHGISSYLLQNSPQDLATVARGGAAKLRLLREKSRANSRFDWNKGLNEDLRKAAQLCAVQLQVVKAKGQKGRVGFPTGSLLAGRRLGLD